MSFFDRFNPHRRARSESISETPLPLDADAQPTPTMNLLPRKARDTSEALGLLRGLIADGPITTEKAIFLKQWLIVNGEFADAWPFNELRERVARAFEHGHEGNLDVASIHDLICRITAQGDDPARTENLPAELPLTSPVPPILFAGREFVLTGKFSFGTRKDCEMEIEARGGRCGGSVTRDSDYLVIGEASSRDWTNTAWGNKIRKAAEYARNPINDRVIFIVAESVWRRSLELSPPLTQFSPEDTGAPTLARVSLSLTCPHCGYRFKHVLRKTKRGAGIFCRECRKEIKASPELRSAMDSLSD